MSGKNNKKAKSNEFTVYIYKSEYRQIQAWVDKHQNLETGGDLFGLWSDDHTAVVQLVLGPGKHCRRTSASFYQDIEYLERVGNLLTNQEGLCHIGEWHSHHRLGLKEPSGGDKNTVWRNMERYGIHRFCLFIATIDKGWSHMDSTPDDVGVNCFFFKRNRENNRYHPMGIFECVQEKSPFRVKYTNVIENGAERSVNDKGYLQAYVPRANKTKTMRGRNEYHVMELAGVVEGKEPEDSSQRSGICSRLRRFCCELICCLAA